MQHPLHLHGQFHYTLARGKAGDGPWNSSIPLNFETAIMRDVSTVAPKSYIVLLFKAVRQGLWFFHCHM